PAAIRPGAGPATRTYAHGRPARRGRIPKDAAHRGRATDRPRPAGRDRLPAPAARRPEGTTRYLPDRDWSPHPGRYLQLRHPDLWTRPHHRGQRSRGAVRPWETTAHRWDPHRPSTAGSARRSCLRRSTGHTARWPDAGACAASRSDTAGPGVLRRRRYPTHRGRRRSSAGLSSGPGAIGALPGLKRIVGGYDLAHELMPDHIVGRQMAELHIVQAAQNFLDD